MGGSPCRLTGLQAVVVAAIAARAACSGWFDQSLTGDGFSPAEADAWMSDRSARLIKHVLKKAPTGNISAAVALFDSYSERHWLGLHLGQEKGDVIEATVREALAMRDNSSRPIAVLEIGAHFGDGTLRIARALTESPTVGPAHVIVSMESNRYWASGCRALVAHALGPGGSGGGGARVLHEALAVEPAATVRAAAAARSDLGLKGFSTVLLDHEHGRYLEDLRGLVAEGAVRYGTLVHADNAGRDKDTLEEYLKYVQSPGLFNTRFESIEQPYPDLVAVSQYVEGAEAEEL